MQVLVGENRTGLDGCGRFLFLLLFIHFLFLVGGGGGGVGSGPAYTRLVGNGSPKVCITTRAHDVPMSEGM